MDKQNKPAVPDAMLGRWQRIVDLLGHITDTPAALIARLRQSDIEMLIRSNTVDNPFSPNERCPRNPDLYCEQVISQQRPLLVPDARASERWKNSPDLEHGLSFYLGYPLSWPDNEPFGTICVLDTYENQRAIQSRELLEQFQTLVNDDLEFISQLHQQHRQQQQQLEQSLQQKDFEIRARTSDLAEINTAMRVMLNQRDLDKQVLEAEIVSDIQQRIQPELKQLKESQLNPDQQACVDRLCRQLEAQVSSNGRVKLAVLTPTERNIVDCIQKGQSSKEIAYQLYVEKSTIDFHRQNIRDKLGLKNSATSLKNYLLTLQ
ncbi:MAG: LuxR C-terminal-related transcriptional regulator [Amphritea sp.]